jgi:ubiquinone/menaquinone biosynthesis C-methylase UbiE
VSTDRTDERDLAARLLDIINASWMTRAASVTVQLGLPDLLESGGRSLDELTATLQCDRRALHQFLRALCSLDICREAADGRFEITPMGRLLGSHSEYSVRSWAAYWGESASPMWSYLLESVKSGTGVRERLTGKPGFEHLQNDASAAQTFNAAMVELTRLMASQAAQAYDFGSKRVADIGGGYGELLAAVLEAHPTCRGLLFDMEHAIAAARARFAARGLAGRCEFETGDFFASVPAGLDVYMLKSVIHDWNDERGRAILASCRRAMLPSSRLLLIERSMPERMEPTREHRALARSDLHMRVALGAQERTEAEFMRLLRSADLEVTRSWPIAAGYTFIEAQIRSPR